MFIIKNANKIYFLQAVFCKIRRMNVSLLPCPHSGVNKMRVRIKNEGEFTTGAPFRRKKNEGEVKNLGEFTTGSPFRCK